MDQGCLSNDWHGRESSAAARTNAKATGATPSPSAKGAKFKFKIKLGGQIVHERGVFLIAKIFDCSV